MVAPTTKPASPRTQLPPPGVALTLFSEWFGHRAELAALEVAEARDHALHSSLLAGAVAALVIFTGFALTLLVAALVWDGPHRGWWLAGLCAAYLGAALATGAALVHRLHRWQPLENLRFQLQQDQQCLSQLIKSTAS